MSGRETFVIVGASQCAANAAGALREGGFEGRVILVGDEPEHPYERPPLSKERLQGKEAKLFVFPETWYREHDVELRLGTRASRIDPVDRAVELEGGERLTCDRILLATGGRPRLLPGVPPGERVFYLRSLRDADRLATHLTSGANLLVVGAGFIGSEVAASARQRGVNVTVLEALDVPLSRVLGPQIGDVMAGIHRDEGVDLHTGEGVVSVKEMADSVIVETTREAVIESEAVVIGIGIEPNVEIVEGTGVKVDNGIVVDEYCRTDVEWISAAGDVARHYHPIFGRYLRVEHYDNAIKQGAAAAENMLGRATVFDDPHWFWSDQYGYNLQSVGYADAWDEIVVRGSMAERTFSAFYLLDGRVRSVVALNRGRDILRARKLVHQQVPVDAAQLRDEDVDLRKLVSRR